VTNLSLVSMVIPVHNGRDYIANAIQSVLVQDYPTVEVIVVDDGSTDGTADIVRSLGGKLTFLQQRNGGQSAALNNGWAHASGSVLGYLSADDLLRPGAIRRVSETLSNTPKAVLAYPDFALIDSASRTTGTVVTQGYSDEQLVGQLHCLPGPGALFYRETYERAGRWDPAFHQVPDLDFFLRMALHGPFVRVPHVLADFRIHEGSATYRPSTRERAEEPVRMVEQYFARPDLPDHIRQLETCALANARLLAGAIHGRSLRPGDAARHFLGAFLTAPRAVLTRKAAGFVLSSTAANVKRLLP
jgi:glycosyltransferase involved in cell wall biosynthesis